MDYLRCDCHLCLMRRPIDWRPGQEPGWMIAWKLMEQSNVELSTQNFVDSERFLEGNKKYSISWVLTSNSSSSATVAGEVILLRVYRHNRGVSDMFTIIKSSYIIFIFLFFPNCLEFILDRALWEIYWQYIAQYENCKW